MYDLSKEPGSGSAETGKLRFVALHPYRHRPAEVQTQNSHQTFGADILLCRSYRNIKRLLGSQRNKGLNIFKGAHPYIELLHQNPSDTVQIQKNRL